MRWSRECQGAGDSDLLIADETGDGAPNHAP